jgi:hypothetical protein
LRKTEAKKTSRFKKKWEDRLIQRLGFFYLYWTFKKSPANLEKSFQCAADTALCIIKVLNKIWVHLVTAAALQASARAPVLLETDRNVWDRIRILCYKNWHIIFFKLYCRQVLSKH